MSSLNLGPIEEPKRTNPYGEPTGHAAANISRDPKVSRSADHMQFVQVSPRNSYLVVGTMKEPCSRCKTAVRERDMLRFQGVERLCFGCFLELAVLEHARGNERLAKRSLPLHVRARRYAAEAGLDGRVRARRREAEMAIGEANCPEEMP